MRKVVVNMARLVLAIVLVFSGFVKAVDPMGTQYKLTDYLTALHLQMLTPDFLTLGAAVILSALEFGIGICLLFGIRKTLSTNLTMLMMVVMTPLTLWIALTDPVSDCGCFGDALVLTNWQTFGKNIVLLLMAGIVWKWPHDIVRFISTSSQWIATNYSAVFIIAVSGWSLYDLPYLDFRPYHIGTDLRTGWQEMMNGKESPYDEFFIQRTEDGEDITDSLLNSKGYLFLLVAPHMEKADDSQLDLINQMYEYAEDYEYPFYALTASGAKGIERWRDMTGAEYPFCQTDETTLRTIIRSNPGLLLLKDGVIIRKWSHNSLPDEYALTDRLENLKIGELPKDTMAEKILIIVLWYILPLLLLTIADGLWAWTKWLKRKEQSNKIYQLFKKKTENEKENRSRQLEDEPEPARGSGSGQGTE
jgi:triosephosphate isomerase